jgi:[ribosomal protein S18]-alanine N-acetyltransferase
LNVAAHIAGAKFTIRDYRPADFDTLWDIDQRCFPPGISYSKLELRSFLARRNAVALVAEFQQHEIQPVDSPAEPSEKRVAGFVIAHSIRHRYGRILTLDILPEARRAGLGTKLMSACEERLQSLGCGAVYLETAVNNESALRLYRKLGYEVLDILPEYYASHSLDAFQMGKRLLENPE